MNKPIVKYLLIGFVVILWGIIFFKLFKIFNNPDSTEIINQSIVDDLNNTEVLDTFSIVANYSDPFLKKYSSSSSQKVTPNKNKDSIPQPRPHIDKETSWPNVIYNGRITNLKENASLVLLKVNTESHIVKEREIVSDIGVIKIYSDSIELLYKGQKKIFQKHEY